MFINYVSCLLRPLATGLETAAGTLAHQPRSQSGVCLRACRLATSLWAS